MDSSFQALSGTEPTSGSGSVSASLAVPRLTLRQLVYFAAAARYGTALRAAEVLNISPPAVSGAIAAIEALLGEQLFIRRHARGLVLTEAGHDLLSRAQDIIGDVRDIESSRVGQSGRIKREINLGCLADIAPAIIPPIVKRFQALHPNIEIRWLTDGHPELMGRLEDGSVDVIIVLDFEISPTLHATPLAPTPVLCALPAGHRLAGAPVDLAEIVEEPFILLDIARTRSYFLSVFSELDLKPRISHKASTAEMVRGLVANGFGYSLLNFNPAARQDVAYQPIEGYPVVSQLTAVRKHRIPAARMVDSLGECARGVLREQSGRLGLC